VNPAADEGNEYADMLRPFIGADDWGTQDQLISPDKKAQIFYVHWSWTW